MNLVLIKKIPNYYLLFDCNNYLLIFRVIIRMNVDYYGKHFPNNPYLRLGSVESDDISQ